MVTRITEGIFFCLGIAKKLKGTLKQPSSLNCQNYDIWWWCMETHLWRMKNLMFWKIVTVLDFLSNCHDACKKFLRTFSIVLHFCGTKENKLVFFQVFMARLSWGFSVVITGLRVSKIGCYTNPNPLDVPYLSLKFVAIIPRQSV